MGQTMTAYAMLIIALHGPRASQFFLSHIEPFIPDFHAGYVPRCHSNCSDMPLDTLQNSMVARLLTVYWIKYYIVHFIL